MSDSTNFAKAARVTKQYMLKYSVCVCARSLAWNGWDKKGLIGKKIQELASFRNCNNGLSGWNLTHIIDSADMGLG